ncbi:MAG: DUF2778 domain-containing protein [Pseudolabrys sp.]
MARATLRAAGMGLGTAGFIAGSATVAALAAAWLFSNAMSATPRGKPSIGPGVFAMDKRFGAHPRTPALPQPMLALAAPGTDIGALVEAVPVATPAPVAAPVPVIMPGVPLPRVSPLRVAPQKLAQPAGDAVPVPRSHPARQDVAEAPPPKPDPASQLAEVARPAAEPPAAAPAPAARVTLPVQPPPRLKLVPPQTPHGKAMALAGLDGRTAVYDISARSVYMPNGETLEAHSGLGEKMDDPRYIHIRMRGPTPPNVYNLTMREKLFHGVRAIRLNPVNSGKMFGRDGMLAHSYLLGPNGQSNGCVSFKDYQKFLDAFLDGQVDRMIVVAQLDGKPPALVAERPRTGTGSGRSRFAAAYVLDPAKGQAW